MARSSVDAMDSTSDLIHPVATLDINADSSARARGEDCRLRGQDAFQRGEYYLAIDLYTIALAVQGMCEDTAFTSILLTDRARALLMLEDNHAALIDAKAAVNFLPTSVKARERGASACLKLKMFEEAITWCDEGLLVSLSQDLPPHLLTK